MGAVNEKAGKSKRLCPRARGQRCRAGVSRVVGTERAAVIGGLPAGLGQILGPWATASGPSTTLTTKAAAAFPVPAPSDLGLSIRGFHWEGLRKAEPEERGRGQALVECFLEGSVL